MKLRDLYEQMILESDKIIAYHGTNATFDIFDLSKVGHGNDQNGPGFYFTLDPSEAKRYGKVHEYELNINKWLSTKTPPNIIEIKKLVTSSPDFDMDIYNWDQTPEKGVAKYLSHMKKQNSNFHAFVSTWYDFYRQSPKEFVENVIGFGYDAVMIKGSEGYGDIAGATHIIVYNPEVIQRVKPLE